jgi:hypothetical protein
MDTNGASRKRTEFSRSALAATVELKDPAMRRENGIIFEVLDKRRYAINLDFDIVVKQEDKGMRGKLESSIARRAKSKIPFIPGEPQPGTVCPRFSLSPRLRRSALLLESLPPQPPGGLIGAAIVDYDDLRFSV